MQASSGNYNAASAAAQEAVAASQRQQNTACGNTMNHYAIEENYPNPSNQAMMNAKAMYSGRAG